VPNLPVVTETTNKINNDNPSLPSAKEHKPVSEQTIEADVIAVGSGRFGAFPKILKIAAPYVLVFTLGVFLYYFFFTKVDFGKVFTRQAKQKVETVKESALTVLEKQNLASFQNWMQSFYFDVSDASVLDPEADNSGNGLSNFQKYLLQLNPKSYDTMGLGLADSEALSLGINPLSGNKITDAQKQILDKYVDMEVVMNRLALSNLQNGRNVAGVSVTSEIRGIDLRYSLGTSNNTSSFGYGQRASTRQNSAFDVSGNSSPQIGAVNFQDQLGINDLDINTDIPGRLEIPSLGVSVPIIWTKDSKNFTADLQSGVVHYPGTALPGQIGTAYISGHSSNYVWAKGDYKKVFSKLGDLADNTSFKITVVQKNGKDARLHYVVTHRKQYKATDQEQFQNSGKSVVALSTCWPVGSTTKRLVVFGQLTQMEKD
ncbi:MAG: sortase, partial [Candidatus Doudnabacteria bacterium]|nr:sortase [Candidatus Doudnabacteria bacterium]